MGEVADAVPAVAVGVISSCKAEQKIPYRVACRALGGVGVVVLQVARPPDHREYAHRHTFATRTEARIRIATWITDFYNTRRLHSVCGFKSPIDYERDYRATLTEGLAAWTVSTLRGD
ncbi:hypothetical protein ACFSL4_30190 [Streptomyces caeni]|uniref:Integrase catalytic domain-containing protein n=1 Tax=Streptomyces caeni TaxID=2307231 RepID=A0ABW4IZU0_9ACTN